jgi:AraC-like DNA-binding protein
MNRYAALALDPDLGKSADPLQFIRENGDIWLKFTGDIYVDYPLLTESAFARNVCGGREFLHSSGIAMEAPFLKAIRFTYEEPGYRAEYDRIFGVPLFFSSHMNGFLIDEGLLHLKLPQSNPYLSDILKDRAEQLLKNLEDSKSTAGQVESLLRSSLHTGEADMENIARKLGVSRHTLFRKLRAEGVTFEKILDELRYKMALQYLVKEKMSVNETTYLLGFSDPATFSRVFKRWTGASPRIYLSRRDSPDS